MPILQQGPLCPPEGFSSKACSAISFPKNGFETNCEVIHSAVTHSAVTHGAATHSAATHSAVTHSAVTHSATSTRSFSSED
ncbi:MAG: hypothetical protein FJ308_16195 [Planctomycetes bacterium]|nr:hypothetical protein [Planctomycetota bacterium]